MIELNQIVKRYKTKKHDVLAVDHVDLSIQSGSIFGVVGFSGAGKSTLIRLLNNLEQPTSGDVVIGGDTIGKLSKSELRKKRQKVSMIFQHFNLLWSRNVLNNITFPLEIAGVSRSEAKRRALELVELVGLKGRENAYPSELSGGQKQRVGIARALANEPNVLLCDEATSALDPQTTDEILELLLKIKEERNLTIVIITHEMQVIRRICDEVAVMENGRVIEQGQVSTVFEKPQHEVTKRFVKEDLNDEFDESLFELVDMDESSSVVRLNFTGNNTTEPIVSYITKTHNIDVNILEANIKHTKDGSLGFLVLHLLDVDSEKFEKFKNDLEAQHVSVEVLKHG
ncbi:MULTISPECIES: methionine ABC transporter ATP-binding protein [Staphylococcus]|jgi:D-methionine transport system ATP-binding protein|uniref:methionine ABC transporter ATP-binding protein n=1 Tax=Staphylococcus TaxID=1279 RepID=UPI000E678BB6|nr:MULTISPECIES: methionine ABC transporter ATP-binding protein [Staphylococcus]MBO1220251.1 methionine ABC transporter ATP-binding protein [Staphylococcus nepalensis]MCD8890696.1 methionine ABC transporter ATP-binding protein [Staphylococcus nepalensis]MDR5648868.1 methionine ABC transporter ATP-binding protein [Staphylococcus nepalensis]MDW8553510.1 methionine ABC transporter ATP-binding protein [Staphylococcus nepalensis]RIO42230.1 methionine ABC transporter ATP-binding protein [Staphylococ